MLLVGYFIILHSTWLTYSYQEIVQKNGHIHEEVGVETISELMRCNYLSEYDRIACTAIYGFSSEEEYAEALSAIEKRQIRTPFLALQPKDDPLHQVRGIGGIEALYGSNYTVLLVVI